MEEYYTKTWSEGEFTCKTARYSCLALKAEKTGRHMVSVHPRYVDSLSNLYEPIFSQDTSGEGHTIIFPLVDTEKETPIQFHIDNHTGSYVKIDFMKDDDPIREVDMPLRAINQINELRPYQSYNVIVDQTNENRRITIAAEEKRTSSSGKIETPAEKDFYLNAFTAEGSPYVEDFKDSSWEITNTIIAEKQSEFDEEEEEIECDYADGIGARSASSTMDCIRVNGLPIEEEEEAALVYFKAGFGCGGEKVHENAGYVGIGYEYDIINKTGVGLAAVKIENVEVFNQKNDEIFTSKVSKIFPAQECVICQEKVPKILFAPCGHKCVCPECNHSYKKNNCPMCRTFLTAKITV